MPGSIYDFEQLLLYFSIARPDIQELLVNTSLRKLVTLASVNCTGTAQGA
jgi:hypothetical protein